MERERSTHETTKDRTGLGILATLDPGYAKIPDLGVKRGRDPAHLKGVDVAALAADLKRHVRGEVRFDDGSRALYATDASNYRQPPIGVVIPYDVDDMIHAVACCQRHHAPVVNRGGGTSLTGATCNVAVVLDSSKYVGQVEEINAQERWAWVQPGTILDKLRDEANAHGLTFGPDPATHDRCTIGGMIGNNSCGIHAQMAGRVADNVRALDTLTYDGLRLTAGPTSPEKLEAIILAGGRRGDIYRRLRDLRDKYADQIRAVFPPIPRRVSGFNLPALLPENGFDLASALVGSEGTCVTVLRAKLRLVYAPRKRALMMVGFDNIADAAADIVETVEFGPIALEGLDDKLIAYARETGGTVAQATKLLPAGSAFLMLEFGGETKEEAEGKARRLINHLAERGIARDRIRLYESEDEADAIWHVRETGLGVTAFRGGKDFWPGWEDAGLPPDKVGPYLRDFRKLLNKFHYDASLYGHFGQGCVHCSIDFDLKTKAGVANYRAFVEQAADLVVHYGGSLSGEHGDGQSRGELLPKMFGPELMTAMNEFKRIWDPEWKMNPGKVVSPYRLDENLRLGPHYNPKPVKTYFHYLEDRTFAHATLRCVGAGVCRRHEGGYMCPSFQATHEEKDTTRGRARMLFEMLQGDIVKETWRDDHVKEALDLCLSCKGCKSDCPVNVDMATLKAEFLAHYYAGRLRPMAAYSMGLIHWWARLAAFVPRLANFTTQTPGLSTALKKIAGMTTERTMPPFATETFRAWFMRRGSRNTDKPPVILWVDTFNNAFHPGVLKASTAVLEEAGFQVLIPEKPLCCGRPLYDYGFLGLAKKLLERDLDELGDPIARGIPVVGVEPSCIAVFRDELTGLLPAHQQANRLKLQAYLLSEFLIHHAKEYGGKDYVVPQLARKALVQVHCHEHAIMGESDGENLMRQMGLAVELIGGGCCGLAGSFGFEKDKHELSVKIADRVLIPKIQKAADDTLVIADGFSCHTQIQQTTARQPLHLAEVMVMALQEEGRLPRADVAPALPIGVTGGRKAALPLPRIAALVGGSALVGIGLLAWGARSRTRSFL